MPRPSRPPAVQQTEQQTAPQIAGLIEAFLAAHPQAAVIEDGKVAFDLASARYALSTAHDRCTLQLWSEEGNLVRRVVGATERAGTLRLATQRFGQAQSKLLELVADRQRQTPTTQQSARQRYLVLLERVLLRQFPDWKTDGLRTSMDLEQSFGPAYARGSLVQGNQAMAVIGVNAQETATTVDGILTPGVLWLHACRERAAGRRLYQGLTLVVPRGMATLTLSRLAWMNPDAARWELWELDASSEEMQRRDPADQGNLRTRLVHHPEEHAAAERFAPAIEAVLALVPAGETARVEQHLRSPAELVFLLHGMEFARARAGHAANSFAPSLEITVGALGQELPLVAANRVELAERIAELFARRRALEPASRQRGAVAANRRIGAATLTAAHSKLDVRGRRQMAAAPANDPLYRAQPERWLESVLRRDLSPLTRALAPDVRDRSAARGARGRPAFANDRDPETIGNRADPATERAGGKDSGGDVDGNRETGDAGPATTASRVLPRLDPRHVYAQVPAIAGASDRGLLDLLGVTGDGRLAVIELKAADDLHFALQGLDYWIRVRHHHRQTADDTGLGEFQRHGYFRGVELSPLPPRLYLVAPALHIHPATEAVLRYLSPQIEWSLLALDERWRNQVRVVWRRQNTR